MAKGHSGEAAAGEGCAPSRTEMSLLLKKAVILHELEPPLLLANSQEKSCGNSNKFLNFNWWCILFQGNTAMYCVIILCSITICPADVKFHPHTTAPRSPMLPSTHSPITVDRSLVEQDWVVHAHQFIHWRTHLRSETTQASVGLWTQTQPRVQYRMSSPLSHTLNINMAPTTNSFTHIGLQGTQANSHGTGLHSTQANSHAHSTQAT